MTSSSIILTKQFSPGEEGHKEVAHVDDADDDAHGSHGQARINVPENKYFKLCSMTSMTQFEETLKTEWTQLEDSF